MIIIIVRVLQLIIECIKCQLCWGGPRTNSLRVMKRNCYSQYVVRMFLFKFAETLSSVILSQTSTGCIGGCHRKSSIYH